MWARARCWATWPDKSLIGASRQRSVWSRRWNWPTAGSTSCARRCWTGSIGCPCLRVTRSATVFGMATGQPPDRFLVGLATLGLLAEAAEQQPLACIIDDAQWLDKASAQAIAFAARRLLAERVALVCAVRTGNDSDTLAGLPMLTVEGLSDSDARTVLLNGVHGVLDAAVCDQIIAESHGNPLALRELPNTWKAVEIAGGFGWPGSQPVTGKIERSYGRRLRVLPPETQLLVVAAAAEPLGDPLLLHRATQALGIDAGAAQPAIEAGLIELRQRVEFADPLVRSAAYRAATPADRQRVHGALADAVDPDSDPDRRAWHRARATAAPNEEVADELVRSAGRAQSRGGVAAGAAFLARATELTPDPARRVDRALDAALANVEAGAFDSARRLLGIAHDGPVDDAQRARIDLVRARSAFASSRGNEAVPLLLAAANRFAPLDAELARDTYLDAFIAAVFSGRLSVTSGVADIAKAARRSHLQPDDLVTPPDRLLQAFIELAAGYEAAAPFCRRAIRGPGHEEPHDDPRWSLHRLALALELWDDHVAASAARSHLRGARQTGSLTELVLALHAQAPVLVFRGELSAASSLAAQAQSVQDATGIRESPYGALILAGWRGDALEAGALIDVSVRDAEIRGEGVGVALGEYARCCAVQQPGPLRHSTRGCPQSQRPSRDRRRELGTARADRSVHTDRAGRSGGRRPRTAGVQGTRERNALGARHRGAIASLGRSQRRCRAVLSRRDRAPAPDPDPQRARSHPPAVRRMAPTREAPRRRTERAEHRPADVLLDGHGCVRETRAIESSLRRGPRRGSEPSRRTATSPHRRRRSRDSLEMASPTPRSADSCSSVPARSSTTWARCSPSSASPHAGSSRPTCERP